MNQISTAFHGLVNVQLSCCDHMFTETSLVTVFSSFFFLFFSKRTRWMMGVFLVFEHVVLAAESAERA